MTAVLPVELVASSFEQVVRHRRATPHFTEEEVPAEVITTALRLAAEAPSGYNIQPWRFVVVRSEAVRRRLRRAAYDQEKITEAPVVIVAYGDKVRWQEHFDEIVLTRARHTGTDPGDVEGRKRHVADFIAGIGPEIWLNRHVMIAFTYLMLAFEFLGWDTAPMEGFTPAAVREVLGLPDDAAVIALLAVGRGAGIEPPHPGRLALSQLVYGDRAGRPLPEISRP